MLLVAMIGAIVLTLRDGQGSRQQVIARQIARTAEDSMELVDLKSGAGIAGILRPKPDGRPRRRRPPRREGITDRSSGWPTT